MKAIRIIFEFKLKQIKEGARTKTIKMMIKETDKSKIKYKDDTISCTLDEDDKSYIFTITGKEDSLKKIYKKQKKAIRKIHNKALIGATGKMTIEKVEK